MTKATISVYPERRKGVLTGWWYCEVNHNSKRYRPRYETKAEAEGAKAYYVAHGKFPEASSVRGGEPTFAEVAREAKENRPQWRSGKDPMVGQRLEYCVSFLGHLPISEVTTRELEKLVQDLRKRPTRQGDGKMTGATINRYLAIASTVLTYACDQHYIASRPKMPKQKDSGDQFYWYTETQQANIQRLLEQNGHADIAFIVDVLASTGMRLGELEKLKPEHIEDKWLRLWATKSGRARSIPIVEDKARRLRAMIASGRLPNRKTIYQHVKRAVKVCGYPCELNIHALRHTFATRLIKKQVPIEVVSKLLGHSTITMTQRYAHVQDESLVEAIETLTHARGYSDENAVRVVENNNNNQQLKPLH